MNHRICVFDRNTVNVTPELIKVDICIHQPTYHQDMEIATSRKNMQIDISKAKCPKATSISLLLVGALSFKIESPDLVAEI